MSSLWVIAAYGFREALRRRMFAVVLLLTVVFLFLFWLANHFVFRDLASITPPRDVHVDTRTFAGAFLVGLAISILIDLFARADDHLHRRLRDERIEATGHVALFSAEPADLGALLRIRDHDEGHALAEAGARGALGGGNDPLDRLA